MVEKDPANRHQMPLEVAQALVPFMKHEPTLAAAPSVPHEPVQKPQRDRCRRVPVWIGAAVVAMIAGVLLTPNTPAGFAASTAMYSFAMFAFGSKAFCNYYFFVIAALCSVTSARAAETCRPERARSAASEIDNHARVAVAEPVRAGKS